MVINIFEVARRFSKLVATIWIIGWIIKALNEGMQGDPIAFASVAFGGLLFILAFTWIIGWVVRVFKGIPKGQDQKQ
jgi:membrane protein CcdC involved in cytochrome C biogenesis